MVINEDNAFVPRFSLKNVEIFKDIPVNKPLKPSRELGRVIKDVSEWILDKISNGQEVSNTDIKKHIINNYKN